MKHIRWNFDKNIELSAERNIQFEDVIRYIESGDILETYDHPDQIRYPGQKIHAILIKDYVHLIPFVETDTKIFLKTIIPSRKATRHYLRKNI